MSSAPVIPLQHWNSAQEEEARTASRIAQGVLDGNEGAESEMVQRYSKGLGYLLTRRIGDVERARDLLQETFYVAIKKLRHTKLENPERLAGYLRGIATRVAQNSGRQRRREPYPMDIPAVAAIPDSQLGQFQHISRQQTLLAVRQLLDSMPLERDRELLVRMYVYDQDKQEIRRALGLSSLHFNRVLFRAKNRFRKILENSGEVLDFISRKDT